MLDDSTSALDVKTEQSLWAALSEEKQRCLLLHKKYVQLKVQIAFY